MAKRKAYKPLYLRAEARVKHYQYELAAAERELAEINAALAPFGRATMERVSAVGDGAIHLPPMEFVAMRAFMELDAAFGSPRQRGGFAAYSWKERPIYKVALAKNEKTA